MSFTDNRYMVKSPYEYGTLSSSNVGNAHFVRICSIVSNTTVTLKNAAGDTTGSVLIGNAGDSIVIQKDVDETLSTNQNVYATGEGAGVPVPAASPETIIVDSATTLQSWYDGSDVAEFTPSNPSDGDTFTQWADKSAYSHNANPTGGALTRPSYETNEQNGLSVVRFDGTDDGLSINPYFELSGATGVTVFAVAKPDVQIGGSNSEETLFSTNINNNFRFSFNYFTGQSWQIHIGVTALAQTVNPPEGVVDTTTFKMHTIIFDGTATGDANRLRHRYNGVQSFLNFAIPGVPSSLAGGTDTFYIGQNNVSPNNHWKGDLAELLIFSRTLTGTEITNVENYLTTKWGL